MTDDPLRSCATLNEAFVERVRLGGESTWLTLYERDRILETITYRRLHEGALGWSGALSGQGVGRGDCVTLVLPTGRAFYEAFIGILYLGAVPVPAYPPMRMSRLEEYQEGLARQMSNCASTALITDQRIRPLVRPALKLMGGAPEAALLTAETVVDVDGGGGGQVAPVTPDELGLLQYTSGSTGAQKGVMLTHANLIANIRSIGEWVGLNPNDVAVTWLPLYHDMGLIGLMLGSLYWGVPLVAASPVDFLRRPVRWLRMISRHGGTVSAGPNFSYSLLARKAREEDLEGLDLSTWRLALCGAEPIHHTTPARFTERFAPYGFKAGTFFPAYGLAENTLAVTFSEVGAVPVVSFLDQEALEERLVAEELSPEKGGKPYVSVGAPVNRVSVAIMDDELNQLEEGRVGQVAVAGECVMTGYFENRRATDETIREGWLLTGDLGFKLGGSYYICGRKKDMVIKAGRNYFAEDIEAAAASIAGVRPGGLCVFSVDDAEKGVEQVVLLVEAPDSEGARDGLAEELRVAVNDATGCRPDRVVLIAPHTLSKTSSGKIQRFKARQWYLDGTLLERQGDRKVEGGLSPVTWWRYLRALVRDFFSRKK